MSTSAGGVLVVFVLHFWAPMRGLWFRDAVGTGLRTELVEAEDQDGLVDLEAQDLGLDKGKRLSVDLDETLTSLFNLRKYMSSPSRMRARARSDGSVPCSGRQRSRSSSCRSIARIERPLWATVVSTCEVVEVRAVDVHETQKLCGCKTQEANSVWALVRRAWPQTSLAWHASATLTS